MNKFIRIKKISENSCIFHATVWAKYIEEFNAYHSLDGDWYQADEIEIVCSPDSKTLDEKCYELYESMLDLWFSVADDRMRRCGHPGMMGCASNEIPNIEANIIESIIAGLKDIKKKI